MSNLTDTIENLEGLKYFGEVTDIDILDSQDKLGVFFASDYVEMVKRFGYVSAKGFDFIGISDNDDSNVVNKTKIERRNNNAFPGELYIIEDIASDNVRVAQDKNGEVYYIFDNMTPIRICKGIAEYIAVRKKAM